VLVTLHTSCHPITVVLFTVDFRLLILSGRKNKQNWLIRCKLYHNVTEHGKFDWSVWFFFFSFVGQKRTWIDYTGIWKMVVVNGIRIVSQLWTLNPLLASLCLTYVRSKFKGESWVEYAWQPFATPCTRVNCHCPPQALCRYKVPKRISSPKYTFTM